MLGHAVLHHLPDLDRAFAEFHRVLEPGGWIVFAGEPSRFGDRLAAIPKRGAVAVAPAWRRALRAAPPPPPPSENGSTTAATTTASSGWSTFTPSPPTTSPATPARPGSPTSASAARSSWPTGSAGSTGRSRRPPTPADVPMLWRQYAFRGYLLLQRLDEHLLEPRLPPAIFYNLLLAARRP